MILQFVNQGFLLPWSQFGNLFQSLMPRKCKFYNIMKNSLQAPGNMDEYFRSKSVVIGKPNEESWILYIL